ncbi:MAG: hypothetical protein OQL08_08805 [Gammaproteobacteria bacterium]|nr:hypothetical protein [Gammaproteobacteria bacterium]
MSAPIYHSYNSATGEYLGPITAAIDPLESKLAGEPVYMGPPANATSDAPVGAGDGEVDVYSNGSWILVPDRRGTIYWLPDGSRHEITNLGIELPAEALTEEPVRPPTDDEIIAAMERAIETHMDAVAQARRWDNRWTCVARAGYSNVWQAEAIAFGRWMDACWEYAIQVQADVLAATRPAPTEEALIAELPVMVWPE